MKYLHNYIAVIAFMQAGWAAADPNARETLRFIRGHSSRIANDLGVFLEDRALTALYGRPIEVATVTLGDGTSQRVCVPSPEA